MGDLSESESGLLPPGSWEFWLYCGFAAGCVCLGGLAAGLTMGLVAIEPFRLMILLETREEDCTSRRQREELRAERSAAKKILPLVTKHHLLLVTLLLLNSVANECLPLFLDELVPTGVAILLSVTAVLLFGEIVPSAIFTGPNQLYIASALVPVVKGAMFMLYPIAFPISKLLDRILGEDHSDKYTKAELRALVKLHAHTARPSARSKHRAASAASASATASTGTTHVLRKGTSVSGSEGASALVAPMGQDSLAIKSKLQEIGVDEVTASVAAVATACAREAIDDEADDFHGLEAALSAPPGASFASTGASASGRLARANSAGTVFTEGGLDRDEVTIMHGALDLKDTTAADVMIPAPDVFMLSSDELLTPGRLADIVAAGHSRIPVFEGDRSNVRGLLLVKKLIVINPADERLVSTLFLRAPVFVRPSSTLLTLLNEFQEGGSHMAVVTDEPAAMRYALQKEQPVPARVNVFGICTLEDIMEALIKEDISDETDVNARSVRHSLFTQQRKQRLVQLARKQKLAFATAAASKRTLALTGTAALVASKNRSAIADYGSTDFGSADFGSGHEIPEATASAAASAAAASAQALPSTSTSSSTTPLLAADSLP